jgi:hypothetical protein
MFGRTVIEKLISILVVVLALDAVPASARQGMLQTRDGRAYRGFLRLEPEGIVVINLERDLLLRVAPTNVLQVFFQRDTADADIFPTKQNSSNASLPEPWRSLEIGATRHPGSALRGASGFQVRSAGTNIFARSDAFHFVYQQVRGNSDLVARLRGVTFTGHGGIAGVMMRQSLAADAPNLFLGSTARHFGYLQWRRTEAGETFVTEHAARFHPWLRLKRLGDTFASYRSRDGKRWYLIEKIALPMTENIFVGLAVASMNDEMPASALFDSVREGRYLTFNSYVPRLELRSGSTVVGAIDSADDGEVRFAGPLPKSPIPLREVTSLRFRSVPWRGRDYIRSGQPGVLLASGDYIEGDFRGLAEGYVTVSSVLFGIRKFECDSEVAAVVLRKPSSLAGNCEVRTLDDSLWRGTGLRLSENEVILQETALGKRVFPLHELRDFGWRQ